MNPAVLAVVRSGTIKAFTVDRHGNRPSPASDARRENELGVRPCRPGGLGLVPRRERHSDAARSGALRGAPGRGGASPRRRTSRSGRRLASAPGVKALSEPAPAPLAVLRIPKIRLEVPVLPGTDDRTLDRAVGHIEGTAQPGTDGNSGIAGHRDGFFRGLKDIAPGDAIELDTLQRKGGLSRRANVGGRPGGRLGAGPDVHTGADAGHLLSLLLRRLRPPPVHRPCRACHRDNRSDRPSTVNGSRNERASRS